MHFFTLLFVALLVLKLIGVGISWWLVFAPLMVIVVFFIILFVVPAIILWRA